MKNLFNKNDSPDNLENREPVLQAQPKKKRLLKTSSKYNITSGVYIAIVLVILLVINLLAGLFSYKIDFTSDKTFSLSTECKNMLDTVDKTVEIIACRDRVQYTGTVYLSNIAQAIEDMESYSDNIEATFKSVDKNPDMKEDYPTASLSANNIIVRLKDDVSKYRILSIDYMFTFDDNYTKILESKVEYSLATAIEYVTRDDFPSVYYTTKHFEDAPSDFLSLLSGNNYRVNSLDILTGDIPEDADYVFIFNPKTDFSPAEIDRLESFLNNGGNLNKNLFVFMSPEQPELVNLEKFLSEWGIALKPGYLYNTVYTSDAEYHTLMLAYGDVNVAGSLYGRVNLLTEQTRPLERLFTSRDFSSTTILLDSANYTQYVADVANEKDPANDPAADDPVMLMGTKFHQHASSRSNVVVSGTYRLISDEYITSAYGNSAYMAQLIDYLDADGSKRFIFPKNMETPILSFSSNSAKTTALVVFIVVIPLLVAAVGLVVTLRRRHR